MFSPDDVREVFVKHPGVSHSKADLCEALRPAGFVDDPTNREYLGDVLRYLVRGGYLAKEGDAARPLYTRTGRPKGRRNLLPPGEAARRQRERERLKQAARRALRNPRERRVDSNTVCRPKVKAMVANGQPETVEQFRARGGKVEKLLAHWQMRERAA